ncbi:ethanolamine utilization protein EutP [Pseudothauera nasutitermitis]|uniref:Ethanolamine utilization protein EutP n=1 Tax=Pseudothauera nasutitermitis TaxID=2565930 RepID=A0A4V3WCF9_9RHOO|nr:EutP/PduV family microcompartment system protein [Pseudothauera nasutitermitis]THF67024.1 ethanolamine utilization protein EutP [Pseudothauera nasutitermitis]
MEPSSAPSIYDPSRFVLVGPVAAGKTTLFNALIGRREAAMKTQALDYENGIVDTPGEFFSHPRLYHALINTIADARTIVYVHGAIDFDYRLPPGLLDVNADKRLMAAITKIDLPGADPQRVEALLRAGGFSAPIFQVSVFRPETLAPFKRYLFEQERQNDHEATH